jgi:hypothetical protein
MIKPGEEWGTPASTPPDLDVAGSDADLARAVTDRAGALVRFAADGSSDLARAVGINPDSASGPLGTHTVDLPLDLLQVRAGPAATNMIVLGTAPDALGRFSRRFGANVRIDGKPVFHGPCTTIVIATGQFLRSLDVVPRGHPGDGRAEVQVYAVRARERRTLRSRLATGAHVPHPRIIQRSGARITVSTGRRVRVEVDGRPLDRRDLVDVDVVPNAYRLLL